MFCFFNAADLEHMVLMTLVSVGHYAVVKNYVHKSYLIVYVLIVKTISSRSALRFF